MSKLVLLAAFVGGILAGAAGAALAWKRAASTAEALGDDDIARRLYWRARNVVPDDRHVTVTN